MKTISIAGNIGDLLRAEFDSGALFWLPRPSHFFKDARSFSTWNSRYAGKEAITYIDPHGYKCGRLFDRQIKAHRAIWALATGEWPVAIDHINGNRADNRLANLRSVTTADNNKNMRQRRDNNSGVTGVCWDLNRQKWLVTACGKYVGRFDDFDSAVIARNAEAARMNFHENHGAKR